MFATRFLSVFRKEKRTRNRRVDTITEQVREVLGKDGQKIILMVRG